MIDSRRTPFDEFSPLEDIGTVWREGGWYWTFPGGREEGPFRSEDEAAEAGEEKIGLELEEEGKRQAEAEYREWLAAKAWVGREG